MQKQGQKVMKANAPRWQRQPDKRPEQILKAALYVFRVKGFAQARMEDVAKKAGISKGTIYLYFKSKTALMEALIAQAIEPMARQLDRMADQAPAGPVTPVLRAMAGFIGGQLSNPDIAAIPLLVISEAGRFPALTQLYRERVINRGLGAVTALITQGIACGEFRPLEPTYAARSLIGILVMQLVWNGAFALPGDTPLDTQAMLDQHLDIFLHGALQDNQATPGTKD